MWRLLLDEEAPQEQSGPMNRFSMSSSCRPCVSGRQPRTKRRPNTTRPVYMKNAPGRDTHVHFHRFWVTEVQCCHWVNRIRAHCSTVWGSVQWLPCLPNFSSAYLAWGVVLRSLAHTWAYKSDSRCKDISASAVSLSTILIIFQMCIAHFQTLWKCNTKSLAFYTHICCMVSYL